MKLQSIQTIKLREIKNTCIQLPYLNHRADSLGVLGLAGSSKSTLNTPNFSVYPELHSNRSTSPQATYSSTLQPSSVIAVKQNGRELYKSEDQGLFMEVNKTTCVQLIILEHRIDLTPESISSAHRSHGYNVRHELRSAIFTIKR